MFDICYSFGINKQLRLFTEVLGVAVRRNIDIKWVRLGRETHSCRTPTVCETEAVTSNKTDVCMYFQVLFPKWPGSRVI